MVEVGLGYLPVMPWRCSAPVTHGRHEGPLPNEQRNPMRTFSSSARQSHPSIFSRSYAGLHALIFNPICTLISTTPDLSFLASDLQLRLGCLERRQHKVSDIAGGLVEVEAHLVLQIC